MRKRHLPYWCGTAPSSILIWSPDGSITEAQSHHHHDEPGVEGERAFTRVLNPVHQCARRVNAVGRRLDGITRESASKEGDTYSTPLGCVHGTAVSRGRGDCDRAGLANRPNTICLHPACRHAYLADASPTNATRWYSRNDDTIHTRCRRLALVHGGYADLDGDSLCC